MRDQHPTIYVPALLALALGACEGELNLDLHADAPSTQGELTLKLTGLTLTRSDGGTESFDLDREVSIGTAGLGITRLLDGVSIVDGRYDTAALQIDASQSRFDDDGDTATEALDLALLSGTGSNNISFSISEDESQDVTLYLNTFASLPSASGSSGAAAGSQSFGPVLSLAETATSRSLSLTLEAQSILDQRCANDDAGLPRLYLFTGSTTGVENDLDGGSSDALRVARPQPVGAAGKVRRWSLIRVPDGDYQLALSCDADNPASADSISFFCQRSLSVSADATIELGQGSRDTACDNTATR